MPGTLDIDVDEGCPICTSQEIKIRLGSLDDTKDSVGFAEVECNNCSHKWEAAYSFEVKKNKNK